MNRTGEYKVDPSILAKDLENYLQSQKKSRLKQSIFIILWHVSMIAALILIATKGASR